MKKFFLLALAACFVGNVANAYVVLDCKTDAKEFGWISQQMVFEFEEGQPTVLVHDKLIYSDNDGEPLEVAVRSDSASKMKLMWTVGPFKDSEGNRTPLFTFNATYLKDQKILRVRATPRGYDNKFNSLGKCVVETN